LIDKNPNLHVTDNGVHLTEVGYTALSMAVADGLSWPAFRPKTEGEPQGKRSGSSSAPHSRAAIIHKNELFFHRWRPANSTYLFGFPQHEQDRMRKRFPNSTRSSISEAEINRLKGISEADFPKAVLASTAAMPAVPPSPELPKADFTVAEGFQDRAVGRESPALQTHPDELGPGRPPLGRQQRPLSADRPGR